MENFNDYLGKECIIPNKANEYYSFIKSIKQITKEKYEIIFDIDTFGTYEDIVIVDDLFDSIKYVNNSLEDNYNGFISGLNQVKVVTTKSKLMSLLSELRSSLIEERKKILVERGINELLHFSSLSNLDSILNYSILNRDIIDILDFSYDYNDSKRLDGHKEYVNTSISFPNYKMLYPLSKKSPYLIFGIDANILLDKLDSLFVKGNAASNISRSYFLLLSDFLSNNYAFEEMFSEENRSPDIPDNYPTDPQAEVLIKNNIELNYVKTIYCNTKFEGYDKAKKNCESMGIELSLDTALFSPRCDYKRW